MGRNYLDLLSIITEILMEQKGKKEGENKYNILLEEKLLALFLKEAIIRRMDKEELPFRISTAEKSFFGASDGFVIASDSTLKNPLALLNLLINSIQLTGSSDEILNIPVKFYCGNFTEKTFVITTVSFEKWNQTVH